MKLIFLGFTFLLTAFVPFPIGQKIFMSSLVLFNYAGGLGGVGFYYLSLISNYIFSAIVIAIVLKIFSLKERLPKPYPAQIFMAIGVLISFASIVALSLVITTSGAPIHKVKHYATWAIWLANTILVIGAIKVLLAAQPLTHHSSRTPNGAP